MIPYATTPGAVPIPPSAGKGNYPKFVDDSSMEN